MTTFYFLLGFLFIVYEISVIIDPERINICGIERQPNVIRMAINWNVIIQLSYTIWGFIGLFFSNQFILFASLFILGVMTWIFKKNASKTQIMHLTIMDSIISIMIMAIIIYKHFNSTINL